MTPSRSRISRERDIDAQLAVDIAGLDGDRHAVQRAAGLALQPARFGRAGLRQRCFGTQQVGGGQLRLPALDLRQHVSLDAVEPLAIGKLGVEGGPDQDIDPEKVRIVFGDLETYPTFAGEAELERLTEIMSAESVEISVELGVDNSGEGGTATVYGCDLTREYIAINADYTT